MIVEWECTLDCNYKCEYCENSRNTALEEPISIQLSKQKVFNFIENLKNNYPNDELFLFGGEPFLHPFINDIIKKLNEVKMNYIIQTNFSRTDIIEKITEPFNIQISIHPTQIKDREKTLQDIQRFEYLIRRIDVMYVGAESIKWYLQIAKIFPKDKLFLTPVADFKFTKFANKYLYEYNDLRLGRYPLAINFEKGNRSFLWEKQMKGTLTFKNKPCIYRHTYVLFDPKLNQYSCSYRENNDICSNDHCFLM